MTQKASAKAILRNSLNWSDAEILSFARTAPHRYKTYKIRKRSKGYRIISQPSRDLKFIQRLLIDQLLGPSLKVHENATAYKTKMSIRDNVKPHLYNSYLLKMDFMDFFPSITDLAFEAFLRDKNILQDNSDANLLSLLFFRKPAGKDQLELCIGSPGSPLISNALMYDFDVQVSEICAKKHNVKYTRYSDDLTFSTNGRGVLLEFPQIVEGVLEDMSRPTISINKQKTVFSSKKFNRHITGITLSNDDKMSIGHKKKRYLRSQVFNASNSDAQTLEKLRGYLAFVSHIEPEFVAKLKHKYPTQMTWINNTKFSKKFGR